MDRRTMKARLKEYLIQEVMLNKKVEGKFKIMLDAEGHSWTQAATRRYDDVISELHKEWREST